MPVIFHSYENILDLQLQVSGGGSLVNLPVFNIEDNSERVGQLMQLCAEGKSLILGLHKALDATALEILQSLTVSQMNNEVMKCKSRIY